MTADQTVSAGISGPDALLLLPLPARLSDAQLDGHVCVYCGRGVTTPTSVGLGDRIQGEGDEERRIFPRACPICVSHEAMCELSAHCLGHDRCQDCKDEPICDTGRALNRLTKMGGRR